MEEMISVVVVTYNQEKTIARTLDSILCQRCHLPIEIVIGEDASTDNTRAICEDYAKRYPQIRLFSNPQNKGVADNYIDCLLALPTALAMTSGWILRSWRKKSP